jgi:hypothetical protein
MTLDWAHLKTAIERGLHAAQKGERGSMRVHCGAAERMLKGAKEPRAKDVLECVHHAKVSLDLEKAAEHLGKAMETVAAAV